MNSLSVTATENSREARAWLQGRAVNDNPNCFLGQAGAGTLREDQGTPASLLMAGGSSSWFVRLPGRENTLRRISGSLRSLIKSPVGSLRGTGSTRHPAPHLIAQGLLFSLIGQNAAGKASTSFLSTVARH